MIRRVAAVFAFLVVASGWLLAQDSPLPGPAGGFSGGTVPNATTFASPVVFTGDNASGTGTLRIRPGDNDTHVVLCTGDNNAATEMCTAYSHDNFSATQSTNNIITNGYLDSAGAVQRNWTSGGYVRTMQSAGSTANLNYALSSVYGTGGSEAGYYHLQATGLTAATFQIGNTGTVTTDIRGPILNGGSATCDGSNAGSTCVTDTLAVNSGHALFTYGVTLTNSTANSSEGVVVQASGGGGTVLACYGASTGDADYNSRCGVFAPASTGFYVYGTTNVAAGTNMFVVMDNTSATGATLLTVDGDGNLFLNTAATRTKGTITLAAGTGTATVSSGCTPTCSDTTAVNAVQCSVSGTTLTANGTGTDVISYHCF